MLTQILTSSALLVVLANAACECGYQTNTGETWQYAVLTDFAQLNSSQWKASTDWVVSEIVRAATVNLNYTRNNVDVSDGRLHLVCSAYNSTSGSGIRAGQIRTTRRDILHGSFRASYSVVSSSPGSVAGFFFYANDTQEIDMEIQSKMSNQTVHLGNQPTQSTNIFLPNNGAVSQMHDYRFDWLRNETRFYLDSIPAGGFAINTPVVNGTISLNMWGNGGAFSGPQTPTTDNIMSVSEITLYFNTSSNSESAKWEKACQAMEKRPVCVVDPVGLSVNKTAANISAGYSAKSKGNLSVATLRNMLLVVVGAALHHI